jgi:fatty acid desaturase
MAATWWQGLPLAIMLGLSMAAIGFNIEHDGGHQAYSNHAWVNRVMAMTMDLIGASSYVWHWKHVVVHHTYTNLTGHDADIDLGFLGRLTPHQKRFRFHRWQHFYLWPLYGANIIKWHAATIQRRRSFSFPARVVRLIRRWAIRLGPMLTLSSPTLVTCSEVLRSSFLVLKAHESSRPGSETPLRTLNAHLF